MKIVHGNLGPFSLAVLFFLYCVYMKAGRPVYLAKNVVDESDEKPGVPMHRTDRVADIDRLNTQLDKSYVAALVDQFNNEKVRQDDPRLIKLIRDHFIEPPSPLPYQLNNISRVHFSQFNQAAIVDTMLNNMETGFFVECGALDGETNSNTLYFEKTRHWKGLLIEADPTNYAQLKQKNRNAFTINACLSLEHYPIKMAFNKNKGNGRLLHDEAKQWIAHHGHRKDETQVQCFPLYSILLALNQTNRSVENKAFMESQGYQYVKNIAVDMVFVGKDT